MGITITLTAILRYGRIKDFLNAENLHEVNPNIGHGMIYAFLAINTLLFKLEKFQIQEAEYQTQLSFIANLDWLKANFFHQELYV